MQFSVIIPLYNKAPYIQKGLESVFAQTFKDFEIVVIDDGSSDASFTVANEVLKRSPVKYQMIHQENAGVSTARNNGVSVSKGDYICFLDADDWWDPTFLEGMSTLIDEFPDAGIYGTNYTIVNEVKHKTRVARIGVEEGFEKGYINYCQAYAKTMYMPLWTGAVCIPRPVFNEMGGFPKGIKLGEDFILWVHIALQHKVAFMNKSLAYYNQDVDVCNRGVGKMHKPEQNMLWNLTDLEPVECVNEDYKQLVDNLRTSGLFSYYLSGEYHEAAKQELAKVDWSKQPKEIKSLYNKNISFLKCRHVILKTGSKIKQWVVKHL